jgi:hypothetical protein
MTVWFAAADVVVVVVLALGVGVGEDVVGVVQPAARTAASITTANVPAKNDFFMVNLPKRFVIGQYCIAASINIGAVCSGATAINHLAPSKSIACSFSLLLISYLVISFFDFL